MIEELLKNPETGKGPRYKASNIVFPIYTGEAVYIVKKPRLCSDLIDSYHVFQDKFFYGTRKKSTAEERFEREALVLEKLDGFFAPRLIAYENGIILREILSATDFRNVHPCHGLREKVIERALYSLEAIHDGEVFLGDAHIKNTLLLGDRETVYWTGFNGVFDESNLVTSKAIDMLKVVYSTYTVTRDRELTLYAARLVSECGDSGVRRKIRELVSPGLSAGPGLWFSTRLPRDGKLNDEIKWILRA